MGSVPRTTLLEGDRRDRQAGEAGAPCLRPRLRPGWQDENRHGVPRRATTRTRSGLGDEGAVRAAAPEEEPQKRREREVSSMVDVGWRPPAAIMTGGWDGAPSPGPRRLTCRPRSGVEGTGGTESGSPSARRRFKYRRLARAANQRAARGGTHGAPMANGRQRFRPRPQHTGGCASGARDTLGVVGAGSPWELRLA